MITKQTNITTIIKTAKLYKYRHGLTIDPSRRIKEYVRNGFNGVMYFAATKNMNKAENRIFKVAGLGSTNVQGICYRYKDQKPGFVYTLVPEKYQYEGPIRRTSLRLKKR